MGAALDKAAEAAFHARVNLPIDTPGQMSGRQLAVESSGVCAAFDAVRILDRETREEVERRLRAQCIGLEGDDVQCVLGVVFDVLCEGAR